jgi:hypothetical protein
VIGISKGAITGIAASAIVAGGIVAGAAMSASDGARETQNSTAQQLLINQRISQAAVRRSNSALNYLAAIRTAATDAVNTGRNGVTPLGSVTGAGQGWTQANLTHPVYAGAVTAAGVVTAGTALSATLVPPGGYTVQFPVDVSKCVATATVAVDPGAAAGDQLQIYTAPTGGNAQAISVQIRNEGGAGIAAPFNLTVAC